MTLHSDIPDTFFKPGSLRAVPGGRAAGHVTAWSAAALFVLPLLAVLFGAACFADERSASDSGQIELYFADIEAFWAETLPALFEVDLRPVGRTVGYRPSEPGTLPACNGVVGEPSFYIDNAFYCLLEDAIVYDAENLIPQMRADYGTLSVGVLLAHEYAHAVQEQAQERGSALGIELQADCFAGSWVGSAENRDLIAASNDLDAVLVGYLEFADPWGTPADDLDAHGNVFDRLSAFAAGYDGEAAACVTYDTDPPPSLTVRSENPGSWTGSASAMVAAVDLFLAEAGVQAASSSQNPGPAIVAIRSDDLTIDCDGPRPVEDLTGRVTICREENTIVYDEFGLLGPLRSEHGRMAGGYPILIAYTKAKLAGVSGRPEAPFKAATVDCVAGAFVAAAIAAPGDGFTLDSTDLDGLVAGLAAYSPAMIQLNDTVEHTSLLTRFKAARTGVSEGIDRCGIANQS